MAELTRNATQLFFQNSLAEVVRKLRASSRASDEAAIEQFIQDTKKEVTSPVQGVKVAAIQKAVYFHMLGYSAHYAHFPIVEVMADTTFANRRIAYVAACTVFAESTDVLPLLTALLKRDLCSANQYEVSLALYCIASVCTPSMARELIADVVALLSHPRTAVRKRAVLSLYKLFLQYPESLRPVYPRLKAKIEDAHEQTDHDAAVRGAVVCVLCELAKRHPANFLGLAVPFYALLSSVHSNWTFIKLVKVFGYFAPLEPRLGKKLVEPLTRLITTTSAKSVQYECLLAVANGMSQVPALTRLAATQLRQFVTDADQNLKFLGLEAMLRLARHLRANNNNNNSNDASSSSSSSSSSLLLEHYDVVVQCLDDGDVTIRCKALALLRELVTRDTLVQTVNHILDRCLQQQQQQQQHATATLASSAADEVWRNRVVATTLSMAQSDDYALVDDFEWYVGVLIDLAMLHTGSSSSSSGGGGYYAHGAAVEGELVAVLARVPEVRACGVEQAARLLTELLPRLVEDAQALSHDNGSSSSSNKRSSHRGNSSSSSGASTQWRVLCAAAFVCGEYAEWLHDKKATCARLLDTAVVSALPAEAQVAFVTAVGKIAAYVRAPCARQRRHLCTGNDNDNNNDDDDTHRAAEADEATRPHDDVTYDELLRVILPTATTTTAAAVARDDGDDGGDGEGDEATADVALTGLRAFCRSAHAAVQERAQVVYWQLTQATPAMVAQLYAKELPPVAADAQAAVPPLADADMHTPFCDDVDALLPVSDSDNSDHDGAVSRNRHRGGDRQGSNSDDDDNDNSAYGGDVVAAALGRNFVSGYAAEQQRRAEQARRAALSAFYLRTDHAASPHATSTTTHKGDDNNDNDGGTTTAAVATTSTSLRHRQRVERAYTLRREVRAPDENNDENNNDDDDDATVGEQQQQLTQRRRRRIRMLPAVDSGNDDDDDTDAEDEATRRLRGIDVTRALRPDEKLPVRQPYAAPGAVGGGSNSSSLGIVHGVARDRHRLGEAAHLRDRAAGNNDDDDNKDDTEDDDARVVLCDTPALRLLCEVRTCKWRKDGVALTCALHLTNASRDMALQDVCLAIDTSHSGGSGDDGTENDATTTTAAASSFVSAATLQKASRERATTANDDAAAAAANDDKDDGGGGTTSASATRVCLAAYVTCEAREHVKVTLHLRHLPASLPSTPLPLLLSYTRVVAAAAPPRAKRRRASPPSPQATQHVVQPMTLPLRYVYFAKRLPATAAAAMRMTSTPYHDEVLTRALRDAAVACAFVPCAKARVQPVVAQLQRALHLQPVDVLRDAMSLYGVVHTRKSLLATHAHVAVLLREALDEHDTRGVRVYVRMHDATLADALLHEIVQLFRHGNHSDNDDHNEDMADGSNDGVSSGNGNADGVVHSTVAHDARTPVTDDATASSRSAQHSPQHQQRGSDSRNDAAASSSSSLPTAAAVVHARLRCRPREPASQILDFLYLGSVHDAQDATFLRDHHIRYIVNVSEEEYWSVDRRITVFPFRASDTASFDIAALFAPTRRILDRVRQLHYAAAASSSSSSSVRNNSSNNSSHNNNSSSSKSSALRRDGALGATATTPSSGPSTSHTHAPATTATASSTSTAAATTAAAPPCVLVHCQRGYSRSATIVLAYLIYRHGWSVAEALRYVLSRRPSVEPNLGFLAALRDLQASMSASKRNERCSVQSIVVKNVPRSTSASTVRAFFERHVGLVRDVLMHEHTTPLASSAHDDDDDDGSGAGRGAGRGGDDDAHDTCCVAATTAAQAEAAMTTQRLHEQQHTTAVAAALHDHNDVTHNDDVDNDDAAAAAAAAAASATPGDETTLCMVFFACAESVPRARAFALSHPDELRRLCPIDGKTAKVILPTKLLVTATTSATTTATATTRATPRRAVVLSRRASASRRVCRRSSGSVAATRTSATTTTPSLTLL